MESQTHTVRHRGLSAHLRGHFSDHPRDTLTSRQLAKLFGVDEKRVKAAMYYLVDKNQLPGLQSVVRAWSWIYLPPNVDQPSQQNGTAPSAATPVVPTTTTPVLPTGIGRCFEEIGVTQNGTIVIRDDDGRLYGATDL
jgi:hypothetical protein